MKILAWKIYSIVTDHYRPAQVVFATGYPPKSTGYEALHITVMGPKGRWVGTVRSKRMDEIAEKDMQLITNIKWRHTRRRLDVWLNLLEALENSQASAVDFVEDFKMNLYSKFMFYTKGDIKSKERFS
jgi:GTP pyrophosphokinase